MHDDVGGAKALAAHLRDHTVVEIDESHHECRVLGAECRAGGSDSALGTRHSALISVQNTLNGISNLLLVRSRQ